MSSTADRFKEDLKKLKAKGSMLALALEYLVDPKRIETWIKSNSKDPTKNKGLLGVVKSTNFRLEYQTWYSEARAVIKAVLPDREGGSLVENLSSLAPGATGFAGRASGTPPILPASATPPGRVATSSDGARCL